MNKKRHDALANDYLLLQERLYEVREGWLNFELTTGEAIEEQRIIREKVDEIGAILAQDVDEET